VTLNDPLNRAGIVRKAEDVASLLATADAEHEAGLRAQRKSLEHYRRAGEALLRAKRAAGHGNWLKVLAQKCKIPQQRASEYMRLAEGWDKLPPGGNFTLKEALEVIPWKPINVRVEPPAAPRPPAQTIEVTPGPAPPGEPVRQVRLHLGPETTAQTCAGLIPNLKLRRTAFHEAGHAVFGFLLGADIKAVSVRPRADSDGRVAYDMAGGPDGPPDGSPAIRRLILALFAGELAARKCVGDPAYWAANPRGANRDIAEAALLTRAAARTRADGPAGELYLQWSPQTAHDFQGWLFSLAADLLDNETVWSAVSELAALLAERGELTGPEVTEFLAVRLPRLRTG
jgi:hypothetical protein